MDRKLLVEQAARQAAALVDGVGSRALAEVAEFKGAGPAMLKALLTHELVAGHTVMMRLAAKVDHFLGLIADDRPAEEQDRGCRQAVQLSGAAARLGERYRLGLVSLDRLQRLSDAAPRRASQPEDPADDFDDDPFDGGPGGGSRKSSAKQLAEFAALNQAMARMLGETTLTDTNEAGHDLGKSGRPNRGRLRHGNPSGDFLSAPRCGARTRAGCACRQPAMASPGGGRGRCRLHGGKSTGARTAAGLARCRTTRLTHGARTAEIIDLRSAAARHGRALRILARAAKPQSERPTPCPASRSRTSLQSSHRLRQPARGEANGSPAVLFFPVSPRRKPGPINSGLWNMDPGFRRGDSRILNFRRGPVSVQPRRTRRTPDQCASPAPPSNPSDPPHVQRRLAGRSPPRHDLRGIRLLAR